MVRPMEKRCYCLQETSENRRAERLVFVLALDPCAAVLGKSPKEHDSQDNLDTSRSCMCPPCCAYHATREEAPISTGATLHLR